MEVRDHESPVSGLSKSCPGEHRWDARQSSERERAPMPVDRRQGGRSVRAAAHPEEEARAQDRVAGKPSPARQGGARASSLARDSRSAQTTPVLGTSPRTRAAVEADRIRIVGGLAGSHRQETARETVYSQAAADQDRERRTPRTGASALDPIEGRAAAGEGCRPTFTI